MLGFAGELVVIVAGYEVAELASVRAELVLVLCTQWFFGSFRSGTKTEKPWL